MQITLGQNLIRRFIPLFIRPYSNHSKSVLKFITLIVFEIVLNADELSINGNPVALRHQNIYRIVLEVLLICTAKCIVLCCV